MMPPLDSLLKYDNPVAVTITDRKSPKGRHLGLSHRQSAVSAPITPPPKLRSTLDDVKQNKNEKMKNEDILHTLLPPREWIEGSQLWVQKVSNVPCTRTDVIQLKELLDTKLQQRNARQTGICPIRRELYSQCFDELIRQVTIICAERGLLLLRVRDEINMTIDIYQTLYESSIAFGTRKALQAEFRDADMEKMTSDLESKIQDLTKQLNEEKAKCHSIAKQEAEKRQMEEKKFNEEIQFLRKTNNQLKTQLDDLITPNK